MDWLIALPIVFAAVTALYAASWVFIGLAGIVGRSKHPSKNTPDEGWKRGAASLRATRSDPAGRFGSRPTLGTVAKIDRPSYPDGAVLSVVRINFGL
jgi:hypothetical protein